MKFLLTAIATLGLLTPGFARAEEAELLGKSCRAKSIEQFYCPVNAGGWWNGPFYDAGCSVKCQEGQKASCEEASCDDGEPVASSCSCN